MTVARNRTSREERGLSGIYSPSYAGVSQARPRSRKYKSRPLVFSLPFEGGEKVPRIFWISSDAKGTVSRNGDRRREEGWKDTTRSRKGGVTWRAAGYCVLESAAFPLRNSYVQSVEIYSGDGDSSSFFSFIFLGRREVETQLACEWPSDRKFQNWQSKTTFSFASVSHTYRIRTTASAIVTQQAQ